MPNRNIPLYKALPWLITQCDKMYIVAQFGAATESLMKAMIDGNFEEGVQFIGQSQGLIDDIPYLSNCNTQLSYCNYDL
jgi:enoyl-[acyl-carrier protein] reductase II